MLCIVVLAAAAVTAGLEAFGIVVGLPTRLGYYGSLPRGLKAVDDHAECVFTAWHTQQATGEREALAVTTAQQSGVLRYYLMPRPVYVLPEAPTPDVHRGHLLRHRRFLEGKAVRRLIWVFWRPTWSEHQKREAWVRASVHDAATALRGRPGPGLRIWRHIGRERPTYLVDHLVACLVLVLMVCLGWAVRPLLLRERVAATWVEALPRHFAWGLVGLYACLSWPMLLGLKLTRGIVVGGGLALVAGLSILRVARGLRSREASPSSHASRVTRHGPRFSFLRAAILLVSLAMVLGVVGLAAVMPVRNVDAVHHWGFAAKVFHYEGGVWNPVYRDVDRGYVYRRYPVLVPLSLFTMYSALGRVEEQAVKVLFPMFFGMTLLALHGAMQRERPGMGALLALVCVAACGSYFRYEGGAVSALADVPVSFFILLGLIEWRRWAAGEEGSHPLRWALPLCGAAVTKTEGAVVLATALLAAALLRRRIRPIPPRRVVACLACVALLVVPWYAFAWSLRGPAGYVPDQGSPLATLSRNLPSLAWNAKELLLEMANGEHWGVLWLLLAVAVVVGWRGASRAHKIVVGLVLIQVAVYQLSYLLTPADPEALVGTTKMRLLLHLAPIAAYLSWSFLPPLPRWLEPQETPQRAANARSARARR